MAAERVLLYAVIAVVAFAFFSGAIRAFREQARGNANALRAAEVALEKALETARPADES